MSATATPDARRLAAIRRGWPAKRPLAVDRARSPASLLAVGLWFTPVPEGLTAAPWHLFALFAAAIVVGRRPAPCRS